MKTEDLIAALSADATPGAAPEGGLPWMLAALALAGGVFYAAFGLRADPMAALAPFTLPKTLLPLALGALALALAFRAARPGQSAGPLPALMLAVPAVAAATALLRLVQTDPAGWAMQATGKTMVPCLVTIPLLALLPLAALLGALRRGAPLSPARAGLAAGLAAGGLAATLYSLHCTEDSPLFWALWYSTGIAISGALGAVAGHRVLRW
ncbi:MAG: NrsF family protein [Gemmobacter sp.]|nr:NrsF family protein [Gemmobacter sp.]